MAELKRTIAESKRAVEATRDNLLKTFTFVPDEKLEWSPSASARSPLWIVAHCGATNHAFATFLRGETMPFPEDPAELTMAIRNGGKDVRTREEAVRSIERSTDEVLAALDTVTEERMGSTSQTPFGPLPFTIWIQAATTHMNDHARQLDYIETIWGDLNDHR